MTPEILMRNSLGRLEALKSKTPPDCEAGLMWELPETMGPGIFTTEDLAFGMSVTISSCKVRSGLYARLTDDDQGFTLVFSLKGRSRNSNRFFKNGFVLEPGSNYLYSFPDPVLVREADRGEDLRAVVVKIPSSRLSVFGEAVLPEGLARQTTLSRGDYYFHKNANSLAINMALEQIINCRFRGRTRQLFLESKALELMALKLEMISDNKPGEQGLSKTEHRGILRAREVLLKEIQHPPSIHELAKIAGMSHPRLNKCFRVVFGCSAFEYLRKERLEMSRNLVAGNGMSMTDIAYATGYANSSHFARAFFNHYGIQPSQYRKQVSANPFFSLPPMNPAKGQPPG
ncbi:MAG: helix-turn-helix transcriptional regulator [Desulfobacteraceae bacterium]|nr:helix-turn-helix transcriptional regulator [Desulfobacteraceae bacterium]